MHVKAWLLVAALCSTACEKVTTYEPSPEKRQQDIDNQSLKEAKGLAEKSDLEGAHKKLSQIAIDSPSRRTGEFTEIENRWAEGQLAKADAEKDLTKKIALLEDVSKASDVSGSIRAKASDRIALATPDPRIPPVFLNYDPVLAHENMEKCKELQKNGKVGEAKKLLADRVFGGIASPEEGNLLSALCLDAKDKECALKLEDLGVLKKGSFDAFLKGPPPAPTGSCAACAPPPKK